MRPGAQENLDSGSTLASRENAQANRASEPRARSSACTDTIKRLARANTSPTTKLKMITAANGKVTDARGITSRSLAGSVKYVAANAPPCATKTKPATAAFIRSRAATGSLSIDSTALARMWLRCGITVFIGRNRRVTDELMIWSHGLGVTPISWVRQALLQAVRAVPTHRIPSCLGRFTPRQITAKRQTKSGNVRSANSGLRFLQTNGFLNARLTRVALRHPRFVELRVLDGFARRFTRCVRLHFALLLMEAVAGVECAVFRLDD